MNKILKEYISKIHEVSHVTFDPYGPGVVRIFLIPPKRIKPGIPWVIIINGESILPICVGWALLLREFINEINKFEGKSVTEEDIKESISNSVKTVSKFYPKTPKEMLKDDLKEIIDTLLKVAHGELTEDEKIGYLPLKKYAKYMTAPHRMDLMISSMEKNGHWACNQKCLNCYAKDEAKGKEEEISTDDWKKIIDKLKEARVPQLTFTGGEPTLRNDLIELIKYSSWFVTRLNTNGQLLTKKLCQELKDASLDAVQITFYSADKGIHNLLVGVDGFDKTCEGIKNAIEAGLVVSCNTPLCELNKDYLKTISYLHDNFGVRYFTCSGLILTGGATETKNDRLSKEELKSILTEALKYCYNNDLELKFTSPGWIEDSFFKSLKITSPICGASLSNMAISPSGDLIPCQSWLSGKKFGNLLSSSFSYLWNSKDMKHFRHDIIALNDKCPLNLKEEAYEKNNN